MTNQLQQESEQEAPWNVPTIRVWEIQSNSTRYEKLIAAPSDHEMRLMWFLWSAIMGVVTLFTFCVFIGVVASPKARRNPFNLYLVCLMIPDMIMSGPCFITCLLNGIHGRFTTEFACKAQSFYFIFGIGANTWLNAVICRQLYIMLRCAKRLQRYEPPMPAKVFIDSIAVYSIAAFVASWGLWDKPWWPHKTQLVNGTACVPIDYDLASSLFFYLVFFPTLMGIPMGYVAYFGYQIYKQSLLPPTGRRRVLVIYFLRLAAVFLIMWLPALIIFFIIGPWVGHWVLWSGGAWSHLQGGVSAAVSLWKPDISEAVIDFWKCQLYKQYSKDRIGRRSSISAAFSVTMDRFTRAPYEYISFQARSFGLDIGSSGIQTSKKDNSNKDLNSCNDIDTMKDINNMSWNEEVDSTVEEGQSHLMKNVTDRGDNDKSEHSTNEGDDNKSEHQPVEDSDNKSMDIKDSSSEEMHKQTESIANAADK